MKFAIYLEDDGRILSSTFECYATPDAVLVNYIPAGNLRHYRFVDGDYIYDPLPKPEQPVAEPTADEILNAMLGVTE